MKTSYFNTNLKHLRKQKEETQSQTGDNTGLGRTTIANYESGFSNPGIPELLKLSNYFDIEITDLITKDLTKKGAVTTFLKNDKLGVAIIKDGSTPSSIKKKGALYKSGVQPANAAEHDEPYITDAKAPGFDAAYMELMTRIAAMERKLDKLTGNTSKD